MQRWLGCPLGDPRCWVAVNGRIGGEYLLGDPVGLRSFLPINIGFVGVFEAVGLWVREVLLCQILTWRVWCWIFSCVSARGFRLYCLWLFAKPSQLI